MIEEFLVLTPEKTIVAFRLASLGPRIGAQIFDLIVIFAFEYGLAICAGIAFAAYGVGGQFGLGIATVLLVAAPFLYFILLEGLWNGQTLGKAASGVRVRMSDGRPITFKAALGRNLLRFADFLPAFYGVGVALLFTSPRAQRFGDMVADTIVVYERKTVPRLASAPHVRAAGEHPFEAVVGDLRGMTPEEYAALRRFCDRFPELPEPVRDRMTEELWLPIARRLAVPIPDGVHPLYLAEATVMKYGRQHGLL